MYFFPDAELEAILSEDIPYGDLTSRLLGLEGARGAVECFFKEEGVLAGAELAERLSRRGFRVGMVTRCSTCRRIMLPPRF